MIQTNKTEKFGVGKIIKKSKDGYIINSLKDKAFSMKIPKGINEENKEEKKPAGVNEI